MNGGGEWRSFCGHGPGCGCEKSQAAILFSESLDEVKHASSLCEYARRGDLAGVRKFLGKRGLVVDTCSICGYAPLLYACKGGKVEVCRVLIEDFRASLAVKTPSLRANCLHRAALGGSLPVVELLLSKDRGLAREADADGNLPLHKARGEEIRAALLEAYPEGAETKNRRGEVPEHQLGRS